MFGLGGFVARIGSRLIPVGNRSVSLHGGGARSSQMTGKDMRRIRLEMDMPIVQFGIDVLGSQGDLNTVSKWVRRLEKLEEPLSDETVRKVMVAYRLWKRRRGMR